MTTYQKAWFRVLNYNRGMLCNLYSSSISLLLSRNTRRIAPLRTQVGAHYGYIYSPWVTIIYLSCIHETFVPDHSWLSVLIRYLITRHYNHSRIESVVFVFFFIIEVGTIYKFEATILWEKARLHTKSTERILYTYAIRDNMAYLFFLRLYTE